MKDTTLTTTIAVNAKGKKVVANMKVSKEKISKTQEINNSEMLCSVF